ncbi:glucose/sorbosone dehydrogenase-like protein [Streptomyces sp. 3MP-14]|uniref:Glucose/sorbosone dehydrogenase-like protein n=1 Tax=Streptomyces mimosae TaxID=2586635 RepID=A0A5N6ALZ7_9ACTN|nr:MULTISPECIES: PQQ-dependent sugar dehydrogenase [Streptomyces]KAB8169867.1 glucose/sorbosone dehydrogenase-like protein [Streptomyces mimosae]KAB8178615.1 glucose/sorbosone dehydrogenase-like protein [Streptomyces sp. 3MP-14]
MPRRRWTGPLLLAVSLTVLTPIAVTATASASDDGGAPPAAEAARSAGAAAGDVEAAAVPLENLTADTTQVAAGLRRPTALVAPDDGSGRLFITEKPGTVRAYHPDTGLEATPLLDIGDQVDFSANERGLLGIAAPPDFADSQELYLAYTAAEDGAVTLARYGLNDDSLEVLLSQEHPEYDNHNGGQLAFGPDGYLYLSIGDGGGSGDPFDTGQRVDTLLGKILRVDVNSACGDLNYCVPEDNPFVGVEGAREEIWAFGLRNPWKFSFDPADGSLWIGDVGQGVMEEVNHLPAGEGGANFGWSCREGDDEFDPAQCDPNSELTEPIFTYPLTGGNCAVIGGQVYRGQEFADLAGGTYVAVDYCSSRVFGIRPDGNGGYDTAEIGNVGQNSTQITAIGTTVEGEFYAVNDLPGGLHRITFEETAPASTCQVAVTTESWNNGYNAEITLTNTGEEPVEGWELAFTLAEGQRFVSGWGGVFSATGDTVVARNDEHNATIGAGESLTLGVVARHSGDATAPTAFTLNEGACALG